MTASVPNPGQRSTASKHHVYFPFVGHDIGGSHIAAFTLGKALVEDFGVPCTVIARRASPIVQEARAMGFGVIEHDEGRPNQRNMRHNPIYDLQRLPARVALLRGAPKGILHTNDIGAQQSWILPARFCGWPTVYHHRAMNRRVLPNKLIIRSADHVIPISIDTTAGVDFVPRERITTLVDPYDIDATVDRRAAREALRRELDLPHDAKIVGFVGNFWKRKRPDFFLDIAAALAPKVPQAVFVMLGRDGDFTIADMAAQAQRLGIGARTYLPGFRSPVEENIAALDVILTPALREPFGRTSIEAALLQTPYVASDDAGNTEIANRFGGGRLVHKDADAAAFAQVVAQVLEDPAGVLLDAEARRAVVTELSPYEHARRAIEIYDRILPSPAPAAGRPVGSPV